MQDLEQQFLTYIYGHEPAKDLSTLLIDKKSYDVTVLDDKWAKGTFAAAMLFCNDIVHRRKEIQHCF